MTEPTPQALLRTKINLETSRIAWKELQRFFASGGAIAVSGELNLIEVAFQISEDNKTQVQQWLSAGLVGNVTDAQAQAWHEADAELWAVVVSPFVLVQPIKN
jgi:hypothetical protein